MTTGEKIASDLFMMLTHAQVDMEMWIAMRYRRQGDEAVAMLNRRYARFYSVAETALFNSVIVLLYSVFEKRTDTVNFHSLLATFEATSDPAFLNKLDKSFKEMKKTWIRISLLRNNVVGHQSLELSDKQKELAAGMSIGDMRTMLEACKELLFEIGTKVQDRHFNFNITGTKAFDNLMDDLTAFTAMKYGN
ncbi:MAG: hypothetical protein V4614_15470 [Pseudomonadota bacterium]